jgi:dihydrofolate reductase
MEKIEITMIMVMTADGVISQDTLQDSFTWTSKEDKEHFLSTISIYKNVIMGNTTFEAINKKPYPGVTHYVLTHNKEALRTSPENVVYIGGSVKEIYSCLSKNKIKKIALLGGAETNTFFLKNNLVTDIYLTVEPLIFGKGFRLSTAEQLEVSLKLIDVKKLNDRGTLLLHYAVE